MPVDHFEMFLAEGWVNAPCCELFYFYFCFILFIYLFCAHSLSKQQFVFKYIIELVISSLDWGIAFLLEGLPNFIWLIFPKAIILGANLVVFRSPLWAVGNVFF